MELGISGLNAVYCNILWFSIRLPGSSRKFIGDHNCVTPHCFPQIESEEEFSSDQDRPARYLLDKLPGNLTDYAIITHKIKITCPYLLLCQLKPKICSRLPSYLFLLRVKLTYFVSRNTKIVIAAF